MTELPPSIATGLSSMPESVRLSNQSIVIIAIVYKVLTRFQVLPKCFMYLIFIFTVNTEVSIILTDKENEV